MAAELPPFHQAFPVHDIAAARAFYGGCDPCGAGMSSGAALQRQSSCQPLLHPSLPRPPRSVLGCAEGRSSARWVDFSLFGHQVVAHLVDGYRAQGAQNAVDGAPCCECAACSAPLLVPGSSRTGALLTAGAAPSAATPQATRCRCRTLVRR